MSESPLSRPPLPATPTENASAISGKTLTLAMVGVLLVTGGLFYWVTTAYGDYNAARRQTDRAWRELAPALDVRYRSVDSAMADAVKRQEIDAQLDEEWRSTRDRFLRTASTAQQIPAAQDLEALIGRLPKQAADVAGSFSNLPELAEEYEKAALNQRAIGRNFGSRLLKIMLNLPEPPEFHFAG